MNKKTAIAYACEKTLANLAQSVNTFIAQGWQPTGVVVIGEEHFIQTLVKYQPKGEKKPAEKK